MFGGIERVEFTAALLRGVHYDLFSGGEVQQLANAADNMCCDLFEPIRSACQRLGGVVLWAVYYTLLSTRNAPGALQHDSIASKLQECVTQSLCESNHRYLILSMEYCAIYIYNRHVLFCFVR